MKKALLLIFCFISSFLFSQVQLGVSSSFTITPSFTVSYGTTVAVTGWIKNKSSVAFTNTLTVYADTLGHSAPPALLSTQNFSVPVTILPGDSILTTHTFTVTPVLFKVGGGGTTVVVWPKSSMMSVHDSLKFNIYVLSAVGIKEENELFCSIFPNPCRDRLFINQPTDMDITSVVMYDDQNREVKTYHQFSSLDVSELCPGFYWIAIRTKKKIYRSVFIKE